MTPMQQSAPPTMEMREHFGPSVPYETYRMLCDETSGSFRQTGLVSEERYRAALRDLRTVRIDTREGPMPLIVPLDYIEGYDVRRTRELTATSNVYLLALPAELLQGIEGAIAPYFDSLEKDAAVLVETPVEHTAVAQEFLELLNEWEVAEFMDPRCPTAETQTAAMSLYTARFEAKDKNGHPIPRQDKTFAQAFDEESFDQFAAQERQIIFHVQAGILQNHQELFDQLWELCDNRFEWLGDYHPVSMEETKDFFRHVLMDEQTHTLIRFVEQDGAMKPAAFGFFVEGVQKVEWLTDDTRKALAAQAKDNDEELLYFHGVVSKAANMEHYAKDIMVMMAKLSGRKGGAHRLVFESTNLSSLYIPRLVKEYTEQSGALSLTGEVQKISQQDYWYLRSRSSETE